MKKSGCTQAGEKEDRVGSLLFFSSLVFQSLYSRELEAVKSTRPCPRVLQSGIVSWGELRRKVSDTERERGREGLTPASSFWVRVWTCCPMGWKHFQSSCYYFSIDTMNWSDSETNCTGMSSHLVVINTGTESLEDPMRPWYLGSIEGEFWRQGEPSNSKMENCAVMHAETNANRKNWNDIPCSTKVNRICETDATRF
uniref:C-type lectin domain-containing protein n=1 Tax=Chrysemys picta bellii TaxID=8478 RepID=A0A8C3HAZ8_CHRPI